MQEGDMYTTKVPKINQITNRKGMKHNDKL